MQSNRVTALSKAWRSGEAGALDRLTDLVPAELHRIARRYLRNGRHGHTLQTAALVNEAYLRPVEMLCSWTRRGKLLHTSRRVRRKWWNFDTSAG
jgi:RNA polymerase sigma-70 factor, ECF subfamily